MKRWWNRMRRLMKPSPAEVEIAAALDALQRAPSLFIGGRTTADKERDMLRVLRMEHPNATIIRLDLKGGSELRTWQRLEPES